MRAEAFWVYVDGTARTASVPQSKKLLDGWVSVRTQLRITDEDLAALVLNALEKQRRRVELADKDRPLIVP